MATENRFTGLWLGASIIIGLALLGYLLGDAAIRFKQYERSVTVKGLAEQEYPADVVIWPLQFIVASNELSALYAELDSSTAQITSFLTSRGIPAEEITVAPPVITDKTANNYGGDRPAFRFTATQSITVYSADIGTVRGLMSSLSELGKQGIVLLGDNYDAQTEYLFTRLNEVKPGMIEEATRNARVVAEKFANDSASTLGKIRRASQGQFSVSQRDRNNPHIKRVRVVSTVEYYLSD